jgi:hypothetical protein
VRDDAPAPDCRRTHQILDQAGATIFFVATASSGSGERAPCSSTKPRSGAWPTFPFRKFTTHVEVWNERAEKRGLVLERCGILRSKFSLAEASTRTVGEVRGPVPPVRQLRLRRRRLHVRRAPGPGPVPGRGDFTVSFGAELSLDRRLLLLAACFRLDLAGARRGPADAGEGSVNDLERRLQNCRKLHVRQVREPFEFLGFETRNKYENLDDTERSLLYAAEEATGLGRTLLRQVLGHWRSFTVVVFDDRREERYRLSFPFRWFFMSLFVSDAGGRRLGTLEQRFALFRKSSTSSTTGAR